MGWNVRAEILLLVIAGVIFLSDTYLLNPDYFSVLIFTLSLSFSEEK
jgi:hypothetical protein